MDRFDYTAGPARIVFGQGTLARTADEVARLGRSRVLLLATPHVAAAGDALAEVLGELVVGRFDGAVMHTPVEVTAQALTLLREVDADCVVSVGGGSTTGLSKALAVRTGVDQVVLPTTYAGSEVTPVLGETEDGVKKTRSDPAILPETVIYDVELSAGLPRPIAVTSAVNAMAHAVEALYSPEANPVTDAMALDALGHLADGLRALASGVDDRDVRSNLLRGAWLAGTCLGSVGMGLHHKLCHTLGGSFDLPHADTHTVVLPYAMAYNAAAAPEAMARIARRLGVADAPAGVHDLIVAAGGPTSLREIGLPREALDRAANLAVGRPYPNPAPVTREGIADLLRQAWEGRRPESGETATALETLTAEVVRSFDAAPDPRLAGLLQDLVRRLHGFAIDNQLTQREWQAGIDFLTRAGHITTDTRQEFVLLSDILGLSSVVDVLTNSRTPEQTPSAVLGPFYVEGPPELPQGADLSAGLPGTPLHVDVTVSDTDDVPLADVLVDVWQSNEDGFYDVQLPDLDGPVLRGRLRTDAEGRLRFWTILPSEYPIPTDGPVGAMLAAVGRHPYRAPHLHFLIDAPGHQQLITQLFVRGGEYLDSDAVFGVKEPLIVDFAPQDGPPPDEKKIDGEWRSLRFAFHLTRTAG